jgi:cytochrome c
MARFVLLVCAGIVISLSGIGCKSNKSQGDNPDAPLTDFQLTYGIGPINKVMDLKPIDRPFAKVGAKLFDKYCASCHNLDSKKVGPPLRDITFRRKPEFIMNMMLNPDQMIRRHPEIIKLFAQYQTPMAFQNIKQEDARAILEYLRREAMGSPEPAKKSSAKQQSKSTEKQPDKSGK